jgi:hypothetical protein
MVMIRGHVFFTEGQLGDQLVIIVSGKVTLGHRTWDGQSLFAIREPSATFGELSAFDPGPRTSTATDVTVVCVASLQIRVQDGDVLEVPATDVRSKLLRTPHSVLGRHADGLSVVLGWVPAFVT